MDCNVTYIVGNYYNLYFLVLVIINYLKYNRLVFLLKKFSVKHFLKLKKITKLESLFKCKKE